MKASALQEIMVGLDAENMPPDEKLKAMRIVRQVGLLHGVKGIEKIERQIMARGLLDRKVPRPEIRDRLVVAYRVSSSQAYRVIRDALQLWQKPPLNATPKLQTVVSDNSLTAKDYETQV
jgi:hypothetical protein